MGMHFSISTAAEHCALSFGMHRYAERPRLDQGPSWSCDYPLFERSASGNLINAAILKYLTGSMPWAEGPSEATTIEAAAADFMRRAREAEGEQAERHWRWESQISAQVLLDRPGIVTVSISSYAFTGGAHGMSVTSYLVFDTESGKQLTIGDLFKPGYEHALDRLIERRFRQMRSLSPTEPLNGEKGGLFEDKIAHNENVAITGSGLRFLYNQYEIAPYSEGQTEIELPFSELRGILQPLEALKPLIDEQNHSSK